MSKLLSCCGLVDVRISASAKDLPVKYYFKSKIAPFSVPWTEDDAFFQDLLHDPNDCRGKRIISTETVKLLPNVKTADLSV